MREILFRGKCAVTNEWVEGYLLKSKIGENEVEMIVPQGKFTDLFSKNKIYQVLTETVGQYTGMTDKNGTKIFEGDIVKCSDGKNYQVVFEQRNNCAYFGLAVTSDDTWVFDDGANYILEVIGNIYDNSELLKGEQT